MSVVIDASAVLAILFDEPGAEAAFSASRGAFLTTVNLAEVREKFARKTGSAQPVSSLLSALEIVIVPFLEQHAIIAADLKGRVGKNDSLADRVCLALAIDMGLSVVTGDRKWAELDLGLDIRLIR